MAWKPALPPWALRGRLACLAALVALLVGVRTDATAAIVVGRTRTTAPAVDLVLHGNHAYAALGEAGLAVFDVRTGRELELVAVLSFPDGVWGVHIEAGLAYLAAGSAGLRVLDVTDPNRPSEVGALPSPGRSLDLVKEGNRLYVAEGTAGLRIVDVTNPAAPVSLGALDTPGLAQAVALDATRALVADGLGGLRIIDVRLPATPVELAFYQLTPTHETTDVASRPGFAYMLDEADAINSQVRVIDVRDPTAPRVVRNVGSGDPVAIKFIRNKLFEATRLRGLVVYPAPDPEGLHIHDELFGLPGGGRALAIAGERVLIADAEAGLWLLNLALPELLAIVPSESRVEDVVVFAGRAYLAEGLRGLHIVDVTDPRNPQELGRLDTPGYANAIELDFPRLYLADGSLRILDVSDPTAPAELGVLAGSFRDVVVKEGVAYLAGNRGLTLADVSNPSFPAELHTVDVGADGTRVALAGSYAYLGTYSEQDGDGNLHVIDVSEPSLAFERSRLAIPWHLKSAVEVAGELAVFAETLQRVREPKNPIALSQTLPIHGFASGAAFQAGLLYLRLSNQLAVLDVTDPERPLPLATFPYRTAPRPVPNQVAVDDDFVYLANGDGLHILRTSFALSLRSLSRFPTNDRVLDVEVEGDRAYLAEGSVGMRVLDVSDPFAPTSLGVFTAPGPVTGLDVVDAVAYVAHDRSGPRSDPGLQIVATFSAPRFLVFGVATLPGGFLPTLFQTAPLDVQRASTTHAYVAQQGLGLHTILTSSGVSERLLGSYDPGTDVFTDVETSGATVYAVDADFGLRVLEFLGNANPPPTLLPRVIGQTAVMGTPQNLEVAAGYAYVAALEGGLRVFDISDPKLLRPAGIIGTKATSGIAVRGALAYLGDDTVGLHVVDIADPERLRSLLSLPTPGPALDVEAEGDLIYVADGTSGLQIARLVYRGLVPPELDADGDGHTDAGDSCPFVPNPDQANADALPAGDACQCGDVDVDGIVSVLDWIVFDRMLAGRQSTPIFEPTRCSLVGAPLACGPEDVDILRLYLADPSQVPANACAAFDPNSPAVRLESRAVR